MILADTSIWIEHFRRSTGLLTSVLEEGTTLGDRSTARRRGDSSRSSARIALSLTIPA